MLKLILPCNSKIIGGRVEPLDRGILKYPIGCYLSDIDTNCVIHILGTAMSPSSNVYLSFDRQGKEKVVDRIQDPSGKYINCIYPIGGADPSLSSGTCIFIGIEKDQVLQLNDVRLIKIVTKQTDIVRRGKIPSSIFLPYNYSLLHSLFEKIYILNFNTEPSKWLQVSNIERFKNIVPMRLGIQIEKYTKSYNEWKAIVPRGMGDIMDLKSWCIVKTIVELCPFSSIDDDNKCICFIKDDFLINSRDFDLETHLYNCLTRETDSNVHIYKSTGFFGISKKVYNEIVDRFNSSPLTIEKLLGTLSCKEVSFHIPITLYDSKCVSGTSLDYCVTILCYIPEREFYYEEKDSKLVNFIKLLNEQNYPWWQCIIISNVNIKDSDIKLDERFTILNLGPRCTIADAFSSTFTTKYLAFFNACNLDIMCQFLSDSTFISKHIYIHQILYNGAIERVYSQDKLYYFSVLNTSLPVTEGPSTDLRSFTGSAPEEITGKSVRLYGT